MQCSAVVISSAFESNHIADMSLNRGIGPIKTQHFHLQCSNIVYGPFTELWQR